MLRFMIEDETDVIDTEARDWLVLMHFERKL